MVQPDPNTLHRLIYRSRPTLAAMADLDLVVSEIRTASIDRNRADGITGLLLLVNLHFIGALEGKYIEVRNTFARISLDRRHRDLCILSQGPADQCLFSSWNMCASAIAPSDEVIIKALRAKDDFDPQDLTAASALRLLTTVAAIQQRASQAPDVAAVPRQPPPEADHEMAAFEID